MNKKNLLVRYDKDLRLRIMYPEARREITDNVVRFVRRAPGMNFVSFTFANEKKLHQVIHEEVDYFLPLEQPFTWKVYDHDLLPNLKDELLTHGFAPDDDPAAVMVLDVKHAPIALHPVTSAQADIRRIDTPEGLEDVIDVLDKVWGGHNTWVNDRLGNHLQIPGYLSVYVAYVQDQPASIAWTYFPRGQFATLFAGSTIPEYRKQGLYTSLLETRLKEIRERGYRYAVVEAGSMSKPIVAKHGFQHLTTVYDYEWKGN
jgi:GNAT superfamily N-acetyltransferase